MTLPRKPIEPLEPPDDRFNQVLQEARHRRHRRAVSVLGISAVFLAGLGGGMSLDDGVGSVPERIVSLAGQLQPGPDQPAESTSTAASVRPTVTSTPPKKRPRPTNQKTPAPQPTAVAPAGVLAVHGVAVDPAGAPVAGMYVYAGDPDAERFVPLPTPVGVTGPDGRFSLACPKSPVLLTPWPLHEPAGPLAASADWAATFVGGAATPRTAADVTCTRDVQPSLVRLQPGSAVEGTAEIPAACDDGRTLRLALFADPRTSVRLTGLQDGDDFKVSGVPPGEHLLLAGADRQVAIDVRFGTTLDQDLTWPCDEPTPTPTVTADPTPSTSTSVTPNPSSTPTVTPSPTTTVSSSTPASSPATGER